MHTHLSHADRITIGVLLGQNFNHQQIADELGRSRSTIHRELKHCPGRRYDPDIAQCAAEQRRSRASRMPRKMTAALWDDFIVKMELYGSVLSSAHELPVCKTTLYKWLWSDASAGSHMKPPRPRREAMLRLPHKRMKFGVGRYKKRRSARLAALWAATPIAARPAIVERRTRLGDWEADTMEWAGKQKSLTIIDRKSSLVSLAALPVYGADAVARAMTDKLRGMPVETITTDRGSEFARCPRVEESTGGKHYATDAGCPWQRGIVEQMNGIVRGMVMADIAECGLAEALRRAEKRINNRPTKRLQWRTPAEVFRP